MHSRAPLSLIGALLLLLQIAAAAVVSDQDPSQRSEKVVPRRFSPTPDTQQTEAVSAQPRRMPIIPPAPDLQQKDEPYIFRLKDRNPCVCVNGGRCQRRVRRCECPIGYNGPHCEIVDHELFAQVEAAEAEKRAQQQEAERKRVRLTPSVWLFYVALVAAAVLLLAMLRVFADLVTAYCSGCSSDEKRSLKKKQLPSPSSACSDDDAKAACSIYTLPPPYSEKAPAAFVHSTPCCKLQPVQQPDFVV